MALQPLDPSHFLSHAVFKDSGKVRDKGETVFFNAASGVSLDSSDTFHQIEIE